MTALLAILIVFGAINATWFQVGFLTSWFCFNFFTADRCSFFFGSPCGLQPKHTTLTKIHGRTGIFAASPDLVWMRPECVYLSTESGSGEPTAGPLQHVVSFRSCLLWAALHSHRDLEWRSRENIKRDHVQLTLTCTDPPTTALAVKETQENLDQGNRRECHMEAKTSQRKWGKWR